MPMYGENLLKSPEPIDLDLFYGKGKMLEQKIQWKVLKAFVQECLNDDLGLILTFLWPDLFAFWCFYMSTSLNIRLYGTCRRFCTKINNQGPVVQN